MSSTQASYPRSPLVDAFSPLRNASPAPSSSRAAAAAAAPMPADMPAKSSSSSLRPPSSAGAAKPTAASARASTLQRNARPLSEVIRPENFMSPETEALDKWFEDLQEYEQNLESMASASLDTRFKDELNHVDQWFTYLNEAERTATVYSMLQHSSQVQIRFFITVLQQMAKKDPVGSLLSPAHPEKSDMMQAQLAGAMAKAELEASQKLRAYRAGQQPQPRHRAGGAAGATAGATNVDRHSFAFGETDDQQLLRGYAPDFLTAAGGGFMPQPRLRPQSASMMSRPRSVIEGGDLSAIFSSNGAGWSFKQPGGIVPAAAAGARPKSADISNWSFGLAGADAAAAAAAASWGGLSPTMSTFSERAKTIERPSSASDTDHVPDMLGSSNWGSSAMLSDDTARFPRRRAAGGAIPETDERQQQVADIVLSMYDDNAARRGGAGPLPQESTSASSANAGSPVPTASNSATLSPYWEAAARSPRHPPSATNSFGRFLNPNDRLQDPDYDYLSDHSESSNVSGRNGRNNQPHARYNNNRKKPSGQRPAAGAPAKEKRYTDAVDMDLLQDVPAWLRSLRLHKYNPIFESMKWQDMVKLDDEQLSAKGVAALGARRKMLKVFEQVKLHCEKNNIPLE